MGRIIYTEREIEDLARRGVTELEVDDNVYLTDLAREKMDQLGIKRNVKQTASAAGAVRGRPGSTPDAGSGTLSAADRQELIERVKSGVIARLGPGVDSAIVHQIVTRVVNQL
jgi:hypothetical protein